MSILWFIDGVIHQGDEPPKGFQEKSKEPNIVIPSRRESSDDRICVDELMTTSLLTAEEEDPCESALEALEEEDFHHLPVTDQHGILVGVVSDRDLLKDPSVLVGEVMTRTVLVCTGETELQAVAQAMIEERLHSIIVIDQKHKPTGILTSYDILDYLVRHPAFELWAQ